MRVMFIMNLASPWSVAIAKAFLRQNHSVCTICVNQGSNTDGYLSLRDEVFREELEGFRNMEGLTIVDIPADGGAIGKWVMAVVQVRKAVRRFRPDAVLCLYGGYLGYLLLLSGARVKAPYMVGTDLLGPGFFKGLFNRVLFSASRLVLCNGQHMAKVAGTICDPARVRSVYVGLETDLFPEVSPATRARNIICTRGFSDIYNNDFIIEALGLIDLEKLDVTVVFTSKGPRLAASMALADGILSDSNRARVKFLGGVSRSELIRRVLASDIYISMSLSDGSSVSLWEAMLSYSYPIMSDIPANQEWHRESNLSLVPLQNVRKLADTIEDVTLNYRRYRQRTLANRELVLDEADMDSNMATIAGLLS